MTNILIIEDEDIIALDIQHKLKKQGYSSKISINFEEIMDYVSTSQVDLVLADIDLPGDKDGIDISLEIQKIKQIPTLFLTAYDEDEIMDKAKTTGPYAYLLKPFDEKELIMTVNIALYRHKSEQELLFKEQWITSVINNISDGVIVTDTEGNITFANKLALDTICESDINFEEKHHYSNYFNLLDDEQRQFSGDIILRSIKSNGPTWLPNVSFVKDDKVLCSCNCHLSPFLDHTQTVSGSIITFKKTTQSIY